MSFFGLKRRGLRDIVTRGPVVGGRVKLELTCGHTVSRSNGGYREGTKQAVCHTCAKTDGEARDKAYVAK